MKVSLYAEDLKPEHKGLTAHAVRFEHLNEAAQEAVKHAGQGVFYECDRFDSYNAVIPPEGEKL